jgi:tRNA pseudouridine13 synthase
MLLDGSGSFFAAPAPDAAIHERLARGDIHPSGALWGRGEPCTTGVAGALEREVAAEHAPICAGLAKHGLEQERRALRLLPRDLAWQWIDGAALVLGFRLAAGCYATTVLAEVLDVADAMQDAGSGPDAG